MQELLDQRAELLDHIVEIYRILENRNIMPPKDMLEWFYKTSELLHSYGRI